MVVVLITIFKDNQLGFRRTQPWVVSRGWPASQHCPGSVCPSSHTEPSMESERQGRSRAFWAVPCARQRETFLSHRLSSSLQHLVLSSQLPLGYSLPIHCVTRPAQWGLEEEGLSINQCHPGQGGGGVMGAGAPHPAGGAWESTPDSLWLSFST